MSEQPPSNYVEVLANQLQVGDIVCTSGKRPGKIIQITTDDKFVSWIDIDDAGCKFICDHLLLSTVRVYKGEYADAIAEWRQKHGFNKANALIMKIPDKKLEDILNIAQSALTTGGTWHVADRLKVLVEGMEDIVKICKGDS